MTEKLYSVYVETKCVAYIAVQVEARNEREARALAKEKIENKFDDQDFEPEDLDGIRFNNAKILDIRKGR